MTGSPACPLAPASHPSPAPHAPRRARWGAVALALLAAALLGACGSLPPRSSPPPTHAYADTAGTTLARIAAASRPAGETAPSGFRLLPTGEFAFDARTALASRAERSLDVQYYHIQRDRAGRVLLRELRDAALRGVRVRLLVDDFYAAAIDDLLLGLAAHPNVEVRLFNPMALRIGPPVMRLLLAPGGFELHNHRMHNKLFVADNAVAVYGGRNVADEYYMSSTDANFVDMDVLSTGQVVRDMSDVFDPYWNSGMAWPLHDVLPHPADARQAREHFDAEVRDATPVRADYRLGPLGYTGIAAQLAEGRLTLVHASARVHADPPEKAAAPRRQTRPTAAMQGLLEAMNAARSRVAIVSPYFVPSDVGMEMLRNARRNGVEIVLYTNSLGSTDEPLVHAHYSRYRVEMLKIGVHIYEFSPALIRRSTGFGVFGQSTPRLHAKVAVVDRRQLLVGSVNLDARSAIGNTEMGVVIDSPELAQTLGNAIGGDRFRSMYRLRLGRDGRTVQWLADDPGGQTDVLDDEPDDSPWLRFKLWLESLFIDEQLL